MLHASFTMRCKLQMSALLYHRDPQYDPKLHVKSAAGLHQIVL